MVLASQRGHSEIVKYLVKNGSNINEKDGYGKTALHEGEKNKILIFLFNLIIFERF